MTRSTITANEYTWFAEDELRAQRRQRRLRVLAVALGFALAAALGAAWYADWLSPLPAGDTSAPQATSTVPSAATPAKPALETPPAGRAGPASTTQATESVPRPEQTLVTAPATAADASEPAAPARFPVEIERVPDAATTTDTAADSAGAFAASDSVSVPLAAPHPTNSAAPTQEFDPSPTLAPTEGVPEPGTPTGSHAAPLAAGTPTEPTARDAPAPGGSDLYSQVSDTISRWAEAWSSQRISDYLAFYSAQFVPLGGVPHEVWVDQRRARVSGPSWINIEVSELEVIQFDRDRVRATFEQGYHSNNYSDRVRKVLEMVVENGPWKIVSEEILNAEAGLPKRLQPAGKEADTNIGTAASTDSPTRRPHPVRTAGARRSAVTLPDRATGQARVDSDSVVEAESAVAPDDNSWLFSQPKDYYTLQLLSDQRVVAVNAYIDQNGLQGKIRVLKTRVKDKDWWYLLSGSYPSSSVAKQVLGSLNIDRDSVWIRRFGTLQKNRCRALMSGNQPAAGEFCAAWSTH